MITIKTYTYEHPLFPIACCLKDVLALTPAERLQLAKEQPDTYIVDAPVVDHEDYSEGVFMKHAFNKKGELAWFIGKRDILYYRQKHGIPITGSVGYDDLTKFGY